MTEMDNEIRRALEAKALEVDVPDGLATRTLVAARGAERPTLRERFRARIDARRFGGRVTGYPRFAYAVAAGAMAVGLFALGSFVTRAPAPVPVPMMGIAESGTGTATGKPAPSGAGTGTVTSKNRSDVTSVTTGGGPGSVGGTGGAGAAAPRSPVYDTQAQPALGGEAPAQINPVPPVPGPGSLPPKIVRTANIEVQVRRGDFERSWQDAIDIAARYQGFVTNSQTDQLKDSLGRGTITMRVPASKLDSALAALRKLGKMQSMTTTGADVSSQVVDLNAQLRALRAQETTYLDLLNKANGVDQVLAIRTQLDSVQQQIEQLTAQQKYLNDSIDYATINATLYEPNAAPDRTPGGEPMLLGAWRTAAHAGLMILAGALVVAGGLVPLALIAAVIWGGVAVVRRRRA